MDNQIHRGSKHGHIIGGNRIEKRDVQDSQDVGHLIGDTEEEPDTDEIVRHLGSVPTQQELDAAKARHPAVDSLNKQSPLTS